MTPLYGHTNAESAYAVDDYPYGFRLRCSIRYWIESNKNGFRFVSQTTNPKKPGTPWNKPKASRYAKLGAFMYLDAENHVQWSSLNEYSDAEYVLKFVREYPGAVSADLKLWVAMKVSMYGKLATGEAKMVVKINGVEQPEGIADRARSVKSEADWAIVHAAIVQHEA